jgi:putative ABC transport system permease protein
MEFRPILSAMLRNKTGALLVGLQIALTLAVAANAVSIIVQRIEKMNRPTRTDTENIFFVQSFGFGPKYDHRATVQADLEMMRSLPGVVAAAPINAIPFSNSGTSATFGPDADPRTVTIEANYYRMDEQGLKAFGAQLVEGRFFEKEEVEFLEMSTSRFPPVIVITRDTAKALFGDEPALGRQVHDGLGQSATVIGIVDHMIGSWAEWANPTRIVFVPEVQFGPMARYVVRAEPGLRASLMAEVEQRLASSEFSRAITFVRSQEEFISRSYRSDSRMIAFLGVLVGLICIVTALGIVGLASFHVRVRTKQIGTRRAVGARKIDIIRYFLVENLLLTAGGVAMGALLAFGFGQWLSAVYSLPPLSPAYIVTGVALLAILGQLAVFVPALKAADIPPATATKTV